MRVVYHFLIAVCMAGLTWILGWWGVAVGALILGVVFRSDGGRAWQVALGAFEGWAILLVVDIIFGPFAVVAKTVGGAMSIPGPALLLVTLLFPALIGWSGAALASEIASGLASRENKVKPLHA
ncbi:MAG: hypothetical protein JWL61_3355 [Gemmatimonadetes bacterium]|jgi:hypothetical protein|nr:hypothetical protein [Gemmatimonadota bacterium]